jgi:hypothetical protein
VRQTLALLLLAFLALPAPAFALRATAHLDALEALLGERAAALAGATDRPGKKQARTATKALARIGVDTASASEDLTLLKKIAGRVAKAFGTDAEVMAELTAAADVFERTPFGITTQGWALRRPVFCALSLGTVRATGPDQAARLGYLQGDRETPESRPC